MKKFAKILSLLMALALVLTCAACGSKETKEKDDASTEKKTLRVATNAEFEPFESIDKESGELIGFDIDLMKAIAAKIGYEVKFDNMEFEAVIGAVNSGSSDAAISGLTINAKRKKSVDFCDAYYSGAAQILIVGANDTYYTGKTKEELDEQLKNQKIGVCTGFTGQDYAEGDDEWGFAGIEGAKISIYDNVSLAIADLKNGTINAIIMDDSVAKNAANENKDIAKVIDIPLTVEEYGIAVKKGETELIEKINKAFAELKADGTYDKLLKDYGLN